MKKIKVKIEKIKVKIEKIKVKIEKVKIKKKKIKRAISNYWFKKENTNNGWMIFTDFDNKNNTLR